MDTAPIVRTFETLINVGAAVAAVAAAFFVMLAGYQYMTAGGSVRALLISNNFVGHDRLWAKERRESQRRLRFALHFLPTRRGNPVPSPRWREAVF